jgi:hypothetical protein
MHVSFRSRVWTACGAVMSLYAALLALHPIDEADVFFHLTLGRAVLRAGARTVPEPSAFAAFSDPAIAAEWLWSVLSFGIYRVAGFVGLCVFCALLAALAADGVMRLVRGYWDAPTHWAGPIAVCVWVTCAIACRVAVRPQLVLLAGLPFYLLATRAYARAAISRRARIGLALVLSVVLWAQLHGSFVLAPLIFCLQVARPPGAVPRAELRLDGCVLVLLLAAMFSSAYGAQIALFIGSHAAGDAPRFISEMARPTWAMLDPTSAPGMLSYWLLLFVGATGALVARRMFLRELLLMLLGVALLSTANRFLAEAALLATPWAARSGGALAAHLEAGVARTRLMLVHGAVAISCVWWLFATAALANELRGPLGRVGIASNAFPLYAGHALQGLPAGSAVLTDYASSAPLGFLTDGRLRTFVDGRTPLYFDDTDFAVEREIMRDAHALDNGIDRYAARAALVRRDSQACAELATRWSVAMVEPLYTTFVQTRTVQTLAALRPCGVRYVPPEACEDAGLNGELAFVRAQGAGAFADFLAAERDVRCGAPTKLPAALRTLAALAPDARAYLAAFRRTQAEALLRSGQFDAATSVLLRALNDDDRGSIQLLQSPSAGALPLRFAKQILARYVELARDDSDLAARVALAEICVRDGDVECARFNATRAAVRGRASGALEWLARHHPAERVRRDAQRWRDLLWMQRTAAQSAP